MSIAYKRYRIHPTKEQQELINKFFGCTRFVFNYFLKKSQDEYAKLGKRFNLYEKQAELAKLKSEFEWLYEVDAQSLQFSVECINVAYKNMWRKKKEGVKAGFPRFKKKTARQSFRAKQNARVTAGRLFIGKFKEKGIKIDLHRPIEGKIKHVNIIREASGKYYANICVEQISRLLPHVEKSIGIDLNIAANIDSDGNVYSNPRPFTATQAKIRLLKKSLSRKTFGGKNYEKARIKLARAEEKIASKRADHLHKLSRRIINENQVICVEDLNVMRMLEKAKPGECKMSRRQESSQRRLIADCGWYSFIRMLTYKANWYGRTLVKVGHYYPSSKTCFHCKAINEKLTLSDRRWICESCQMTVDRDHNAAQNILHEGLRLLSLSS